MLALKRILVTTGVAALMAVGSGFVDGARASTVTKDLGTLGSCTYGGVGAGVSESTDCTIADPLGNGGNTTLTQMIDQELFAIDSWSFADKINREETLLGELFTITVDSAATGGTWSLLDGLSFAAGEDYAIALKSSNASVVYLLDPSANNGTWSSIDLLGPQDQQQALSNITLFGTAAPIPLPAAGWLLLSAIGGLGIAARRRRKSS